jgi:hypothetical protein
MPVTSAVVVQNVLKMAAIPDRKQRPSNLLSHTPSPPPPRGSQIYIRIKYSLWRKLGYG